MGYDSGTHCTLPDVAQGYILYSFLSNGELSSASFWRFTEVVLVGDMYTFYGAPLAIRSTKYWTATIFETDEYLIYVSARYDNLYARVRYLWVRYR